MANARSRERLAIVRICISMTRGLGLVVRQQHRIGDVARLEHAGVGDGVVGAATSIANSVFTWDR